MVNQICIGCPPLELGEELASFKTPGLTIERMIPQGVSEAPDQKEEEWMLRMLSKNKDAHYWLGVTVTSPELCKPRI